MLRTFLIRLLLLPLTLVGTVAWADSNSQTDSNVRLAHMLDMSSNADLVRDSKLSLDMMDAMTEPEFLVAAMAMSANPEIWLKALEQAGAPGVPKNLSRMADPAMMTEWFYSSVDPQYQQAIVSRLFDPKKPQRWMQAMANPRFYMDALAVMPAAPMQWMKVTADGRMINPMQIWFDPKTYLNWMRLPEPAAGKKTDKPATTHAWKPPQRY